MSIFEETMQKLYGANIWNGFLPSSTEDNVQGWNGLHPSLSRLASIPGAKVIVDVGVWKGQSTITMANALKKNKINGVIIAVDTFLGSPEHWTITNKHFCRSHGLPDLFHTFMSNVYNAQLTDFIIPMAQTSSTAAKLIKKLGIKPALVHVDAAHEYREAIQDIEDYWEVLSDNGFLIGDDYHETWPGVVQAAGEFSARTKLPLAIEPPKFILKKIPR